MAFGIYNKFGSVVTGSPVLIDVQADANFIGQALLLVSFGKMGGTGSDDAITFRESGNPGDPFAVLAFCLLRVNGQFTQLEIATASTTPQFFQLSIAESVGVLPEFSVLSTGGGGGGGGGGAPTNAPYLLQGPAGSLPAAVDITSLGGGLSFIINDGSSTGGSLSPVLTSKRVTTDTFSTGTGIAMPFVLDDTTGSVQLGAFEWIKSHTTHSDLYIKGYYGEDLASLKAGVGGPITFAFPAFQNGAVGTNGSGSLTLFTAGNAGVNFNVNGHDTMTIGQGTMEFKESFTISNPLHTTTLSGTSVTILEATNSTGIVVSPTNLEVDVEGLSWTFDNGGNINCPNGEIKTIHDATADTSAPSWGQVKSYVSGSFAKAIQVFGATTTGPNLFDIYALLCGGMYGPGLDFSGGLTEAYRFRATGTIEITELRVACDVGPTGGPQSFQLWHNGLITGGSVLLTAGQTSNQTNISLFGAAGDYFEIRAENGTSCAPGASGVMLSMQYTLS